MHNNYFFLKKLVPKLKESISEMRLMDSFSQNKDELVLGFHNHETTFYIKCRFSPTFSCLSFHDVFNRAKANSVDLFEELRGLNVKDIIQHQNERSFHIEFENNYSLYFKLFGNRSNLILFKNGQAMDLFHKKFPKDLNLSIDSASRDLAQDYDTFLKEEGNWKKLFPTFGDIPEQKLLSENYDQRTYPEKWKLIQDILEELEDNTIYITRLEGKIRLSLLKFGDIVNEFADPIEANNVFVATYYSVEAFDSTYKETTAYLTKKLASINDYLLDLQKKLHGLKNDPSPSETADIIMANLSNIPPKAESFEAYDFYHDINRTIALKRNTTPQKYAEALYKKARNRRIEIEFLESKIESRQKERHNVIQALEELEEIKTLKELRAFVKNSGLELTTEKQAQESPFKEFSFMGYKILVGKNAQNNDLLTFKHSYKEDLWLHAKDVKGSHVLIKYQAGKNFPNPVIETAAQLAGYYSKRKTDSLCPVIYTPKKYVRKSKGAAVGEVVVERENVILIQPQNPFERSLN